MKKLLFILLLASKFGHTQIKFGNNPNVINPNAILEMESTNKGLLLPRVALVSADSAQPLSAFTPGLAVYNTATAGVSPNNVLPGFYFCTGTRWQRMLTSAATNSLSSAGGAIISNVDGVVASLMPDTGSIVSVVGFDSSGVFATQPYSPVTNGTDWLQIGNTLMQSGTSANTATAATKSISFTKPFTNTPSVACTYAGTGNVAILVTAVSNTSFTWKSVNAATGADAYTCNIHWQAMGN